MSAAPATAPDLLAAIVAATRHVVEARQGRVPLSALASRAERRQPSVGGFRDALSAADPAGAPRVVAECKRRSPSRGVLKVDYDPVAIAAAYERAGAAAVSVLTEPTFFDGALEHLEAVRAAVRLPLLRKDFVVSEYQLFEARAAGADAVLLIVSALEPAELARLHRRADDLGLDVLVEVHAAAELPPAIDAGARMIGVNNRNLRTLAVDVGASEAVMDRLPREVIAVSESGLKTADDLRRLRRLGYHAFLIGERFMTADDPGAALRTLLETAAVGPGSLRAKA
jgi:indole-3-glycerol phosphate synthase